MHEQFVIIHGVGRNGVERLSHRALVDAIRERLPATEFHVVKWDDLGFCCDRADLGAESQPFQPPMQELLRREAGPYLFDRLALLHQIRERDVTAQHPSWTVKASIHRGELRLLGMLLDYAGDVEIYLRDASGRVAIQERLREKLIEAQGRGPLTVIAHSLGTLVAYDVIHQRMPPEAVHTLVTLGSPLENLLYLAQGFGPITYNLKLDAALNWLNFYDIKDLLGSKLVSGDFAREPRDDWLWSARSKLGARETEFVREGSDEVRSVDRFWNGRELVGLRTNIGLNRGSSSFEAHRDYWKYSIIHGAVAEIIISLVARRGS